MDKFHAIDGLIEQSRRDARREWTKRRLENIHAHVSAADVLVRHGVTLHRDGSHPEQISCPFHGNDLKPSAKYFPADGESRSHVWCFVCHERWDVVTLWKKFSGTEQFTEILWQIEREFGVTPPERTAMPEHEAPYDPMVDEVQQLFDAAERRLREFRSAFSLEVHLKLGQILDHTRYYLDAKQIALGAAKERLSAMNAKLLEKMRAARAETPADT